ncbi:MAG TPA: hypothetical protein VE645_14195 [Pseudonocardiaceae bacterium]|nr:hypothetical protein [Pseudonocardiaceae bacterium]
MGTQVVTVNDVLDGHVALDLQCLDRIYLNAYVPKLQTSAQVVAVLSGIWVTRLLLLRCSTRSDSGSSCGGAFRPGQRHPVGEVR